MRTNETLNGVLPFNHHNHPFSLVKLKKHIIIFSFANAMSSLMKDVLPFFILPLNKEHQFKIRGRRSGSA